MVEVESYKRNFIMANWLIHIYSFSKKDLDKKWSCLFHTFAFFFWYDENKMMMVSRLWKYLTTMNNGFTKSFFFLHHALDKKTRFQLCFTWENLCAWLVKINMKNDFHTNNKKIVRPYHISRPILHLIIVVYGINLS